MGRGKKKIPYEEGSLRDLYKILVVPLLKAKKTTQDIKDFLEQMFCVDTRIILRYKVRLAFKMPGILCITPLTSVPGLKAPQMTSGQEVWVRNDLVLGKIDLEFWDEETDNTTWYRLTTREFERIQKYLKHWPFKPGKDKELSWEAERNWRLDDDKPK